MMSIQIQIDIGIHKGEQIRFLVPETIDVLEIVPAGKMITDSDKLSFVYLIDGEDSYGQVHFPQVVWPLMVEVLKSETDPQLVQGEKSVVLTDFIEELTMLIFNIEGNNNYGEGFSTAVEQAFEEVLQGTK
ncbi:hypothetical protein [Sporosarcina ureilytica]|nr:hypothetical protein [Sporosarcina ureilytica]